MKRRSRRIQRLQSNKKSEQSDQKNEEPSVSLEQSQSSKEPPFSIPEQNQLDENPGSSNSENLPPQEPSSSSCLITGNTCINSETNHTCINSKINQSDISSEPPVMCQEIPSNFSPSSDNLQTSSQVEKIVNPSCSPDMHEECSIDPSNYEVLSLEIPCVASHMCSPSPERLADHPASKEEEREDSPLFTIDCATGNFNDFFSIQQPECIVIDDDDEEEVPKPPISDPEAQLDSPTLVPEANLDPTMVSEANLDPTMAPDANLDPPTLVPESNLDHTMTPDANLDPPTLVPESNLDSTTLVPEANLDSLTMVSEANLDPTIVPDAQLDPTTMVPEAKSAVTSPNHVGTSSSSEEKLLVRDSIQTSVKKPLQPDVRASKISSAIPPNTQKAEFILIDLADDDDEEMVEATPPPCAPDSVAETRSTPSVAEQLGTIDSHSWEPAQKELQELDPNTSKSLLDPASQQSSPKATSSIADSAVQTLKRPSLGDLTEPAVCLKPPTKKIAMAVSSAAESTTDCVEQFRNPEEVVKLLPRRPSPMFVGRMSEQMTLVAALDHQDSSHLVDVAITGPPGVGKTELLLNTLEANADSFDNILWLDATSDKTLEDSILYITKKLGTNVDENLKNMSLNLLIKNFYTVFYNKRTLIVFDNASNPIDLTNYLPSRVTKGYNLFFVITSQYTEWDCGCQISLKKFSASDSKEFLKQNLPRCRTQDIREVAEMLGHSPLALHAAVMYVKYKQKVLQFKQQDYTLRNFLTEFNENPVDFLDFKFKNDIDISMFYKSTIEKLQNNVNENTNGMFLLNLMVYSEISNYEMMLNLINQNDEKQLQDSLLFLKENSLIENEGQTILINQMLKIYIKFKCQNELGLYQILNAFKCKLEIEPNCSVNFIHCLMKIWHCAKKCEILVREFSMLPRIVVNSDHISTEEKLSFIESSIEYLEEYVGWHYSDDLLYIQMEKAFLLVKHESYEEAYHVCNTILKVDLLEKNAKLYYFVISIKSNCLQELNKLDESFIFVKYCFEETLKKYGGSDLTANKLLKLLCSISEKLSLENNFETWQQVLTLVAKRAMLNDANHEQTLEIINTIKESLLKFERGNKVLILYERLYMALEKKFGKLHQLTLKTLFYNALCLYDLNRLDESWDLFSNLLQIQMEEEHDFSETLAKMCAVACKLEQSGKIEPWNTWHNWAHSTVLDVLTNPESSLRLLQDASVSMRETGRLSDAETLFDQLHSTMTIKLGDTNSLTLQCLLVKAECLCRAHSIDKAWDIYVNVCNILKIELVNKPDDIEELIDLIQTCIEICVL